MKHVTSEGANSRRNTGAVRGKMMCARADRKEQIEREIAEYQSMYKKGLSMRQIAKRIGMSPSNHLMSILWDMSDEQRLISKPRDYRRGIVAWDFRLPPDRLSRLNF